MKSALRFWRSILGATIVIFGLGLWRLSLIPQKRLSFWHSTFTFLWAIPLGIVIFLMIFSWTRAGERFAERLWKKNERPAGVGGYAALIVFIAALPLYSLMIFFPYDTSYSITYTTSEFILKMFSTTIGFISIRVLIFWIFVLLGMVCTKIAWRKLTWPTTFFLSLLTNAVVYCVAWDFSKVNNNPLALGWSDASRLYGASLFFATRLYGQAFALSVLHSTWHLLLTIPFFFGNLPIWIHRFWQAYLQFSLTLATGFVLAKRLGLTKRLVFWGVAFWAFLLIREVSILFSLLICVIIIFGWAKPRKYWLTTCLVLLSSIWAGLSRINWFPVPGLLAAVVYLLEVPTRDSRSTMGYLWKPASWFLGGTAVAFGANSLYYLWSGNGNLVGQTPSSLSSNLLWYRLWPSSVSSFGILLPAVLTSIPIILIIVLALRRQAGQIHPLRLAGIFVALAVLFAGGLVVSVKIGGGGDLHNLDAYFILLMLLGGYFYFGRWTPESPVTITPLNISVALVLAVVVPVWFILRTGGSIFPYDPAQANNIVNTVKTQTEQAAQKGGEVLFIYQRQLLALKMIDVPLVPDYEQDYLMEMVMSHNQAYLDRFQADLKAQKFAVIVASNYWYGYEEDNNWSEENNLWVQDVVLPLRCYYEVIFDDNIALFRPRSTPCK